LGYNSEEGADKFYIDLLCLKKIRSKIISKDLGDKFFGVKREVKFILYADDDSKFEVFITNDTSKASDIFTHPCILIENRDEFLNRASSMGFECVKVSRQDNTDYYLFIKDSFQNLYEIKERL